MPIRNWRFSNFGVTGFALVDDVLQYFARRWKCPNEDGTVLKKVIMKKIITLVCLFCGLLAGGLTGCEQADKPLKEGVVWSVRWIESSTANSSTTAGFYRTDKVTPGLGGSYGKDMYGLLYPSHLEVRFVGSRDSHAQIIPMHQIVWLEFGDGGVTVKAQ